MTTHPLENWKQYLSIDDYDYLIRYIENVKNNISNDKMIILSGPGRSGKTTLQNEIRMHLGDENCGNFPMNSAGDILYSENIQKLGLYCELADISRSKKSNTAILNLIKYKQSLIAATVDIGRVNPRVLEHSRVIQMEHVF